MTVTAPGEYLLFSKGGDEVYTRKSIYNFFIISFSYHILFQSLGPPSKTRFG